jgi:hypothetical protein
MSFRKSQLRVTGLGLSLLGLALGGAFLVPEVFYPNHPFPRGPHLSDMLGLGAAACLMLALFRWIGRHMIRTGRIRVCNSAEPADPWIQWAWQVDSFGKVIDD